MGKPTQSMRVVCALEPSVTHRAVAWLLSDCPPAVLSWSVPRKGARKESGLVLCEQNIGFGLCLCLPKGKLAWPPPDTSPDTVTDATACKDLGPPVPAATPPWSLHVPGWAGGRDPPACGKGSVGSCEQRLLRAAQMCGTEADGLPRAEIYDLLK